MSKLNSTLVTNGNATADKMASKVVNVMCQCLLNLPRIFTNFASMSVRIPMLKEDMLGQM